MIRVDEPTVDETIEILSDIKETYEKHHNIKIDQSAIEAAAKLSDKYINYRFLPDKAIDLIDEASAKKTLEIDDKELSEKLKKIRFKIEELAAEKERLISSEKFEEAAKTRDEELKLTDMEKKIVNENISSGEKITDRDIATLVSDITKIPVGDLLEEEIEKFKNINKELSKHIAGQREAISQISRALKRNRSGISNTNRPIGSFIFLGPSGVGKTEVARVLARYIYGSEKSLVKIDMSEFMERHNTSRLLGAPPGYVGYDDAGKLTEAVRQNPYSVVLFDEIEKAHTEVFNILLQLLDEGKLTDAKGRTVDFANTIIILTSNIGLEEYKKISSFGFNEGEEKNSDVKSKVQENLSKVFQPEFLNRLDKVIVFDPLGRNELKIIALLQLDILKKKLEEKKIKLSFNKDVLNYLSDQNYDQIYGARPLIREIEDKISNDISELIIAGKIKQNGKVKLSVSRGKIKVSTS